MIQWPWKRAQAFPPCPACPSDDFAVGASTLRGAPIVTCIGCGARWYLSGGAWRKPHSRALPAAWSQVDALERMEQKQERIAQEQLAAQRTGNTAAPLPSRRSPNQGFRRPPPVQEEA